MSRLVVSCLAALAFFGLVPSSTAAAQERWVVMIYAAGDNDLEQSVAQQLFTLERANANANVDVLVQADFRGNAGAGLLGEMDWDSGARRFRMSGGMASDVENVGRIDSGSPRQLQAFLSWALQTTSLREAGTRHALVVIGPGSGYRGALQDTSLRTASQMTAGEIASAIQGAYDGSDFSARSLQVLGIGASLFGTVENAATLGGRSSEGTWSTDLRLVVSEEVFPRTGFAFHTWLSYFGSDGADLTAAGIGAALARSVDLTDRERVIAVVRPQALSELLSDLNTMGTNYEARHASLVSRARAGTQSFGASATNDPYGLVDLRRLLRNLDAQVRQAEISWDGRPPENMRDCVEYIQRGESRYETGGLSIYLPQGAAISGNPSMQVGAEWSTFTSTYASQVMADRTPPMVEEVQAQEADQEGTAEEGAGGGMPRMVRITATTAGDDIDDVTVTLGVPFERGVAFLGEIPLDQGGGGEEDFAGGAIDFAWNGAWIGLFSPGATDADPAAFFLLDRYTTEAGQARSTYAVPVEVWDGFSEVETLEEGLLVFDVDAATLEGPLVGLYAVDDSATDADGVYELDLDADAVVIPMIPVISETGDWELLEGYPISTAGLSASSFDVPDGDYAIGLQVSDLAGNETTELVPVYLGPDVIVPASGGCSVSARSGARGGLVWLALLVVGAVVARARRRAAAVAVAAMSSAAAVSAGCGPSGGSTSDAGRDARLFVMDTGACDDEDMDGVCDSDDACWGHPDGSDGDRDGVPDACDCDASGSMCDDDAECADGDDGVVCNCNPGFVGDGTLCIPEGIDGGMMMRTDAGMPDVDAGPEPDLGAVALFVDRASDRATLLYVAADGSVISSGATTGAAIGNWDYAVGVVDEPADTARVLFYDTVAGGGRYVSIDLATREATVLIASVALSAGWDVIEPVACDLASCERYFFHDADAGTVAVVDFAGVGLSWSTMQTDTGTIATGYDDAWRQAWNDGGQGRIGLHRPSDGFYGRVAITHTGADRGRFVRSGGNIVVDFLGGTFAGFDSVTPIAEVGWLGGAGTSDEVFNYRRDGSGQVGRMAAGSAIGLRDWPAGSFGAWTDIVTLDNGNTVFYDAAGSAGVVGRFTVGGTVEFANLATYTTPGAGFEHVTALLSPTP
jgi:hypothetical protein